MGRCIHKEFISKISFSKNVKFQLQRNIINYYFMLSVLPKIRHFVLITSLNIKMDISFIFINIFVIESK